MAVRFRKHSQLRPDESIPMEEEGDVTVDLRKKLTSETGRLRRKADVEVVPKINQLMEKGLIDPEATGKMGDPETLDQFIRLYNIGANEEVICKVLSINMTKYKFLLRKYQDICVDGIVTLGPLGVLGTAYTRIHDLSQQALGMLSTLDLAANKEDRKQALELLRFIKDAESAKVTMMVTTGAIAQKKKVEIHQHFDASTKDPKVVSPAKLIGLLEELLGEDEQEFIEGEVVYGGVEQRS